MKNHTRRGGLRVLDTAAARMTVAAYAGADRMRLRRGNRGVTMIEYVVMVSIVIVLAVLLRSQLSAMFSSLLTKLRGSFF